MDDKLKKIYELEAKKLDLEAEDEIDKIIREGGGILSRNPSDTDRIHDAVATSVVRVKERAKEKKEILKARLETEAIKNQFQPQGQWYVYDYSDKTFQISGKGSLNFKTKRDRYYQSTLFEILFEHWEKDKSKPSVMSKSEIISEVSKRLDEDWDLDKLRSNLGHLEVKIKTNPKIANLITFDRHHRERIIFDIHNPYRS